MLKRISRRVTQEHNTGCGLACIATLADKTYHSVLIKAKEVLPAGFGLRRNFRTQDTHLRALGKEYRFCIGRPVRFRGQERDYFWSLEAFVELMQRKVPDCHAVVAVNPQRGGERWHWVVWDCKRSSILDPKIPPYKWLRPLYYLRVS